MPRSRRMNASAGSTSPSANESAARLTRSKHLGSQREVRDPVGRLVTERDLAQRVLRSHRRRSRRRRAMRSMPSRRRRRRAPLHRRTQTASAVSSASIALAAVIASARTAPAPSLRPLRWPSRAPSGSDVVSAEPSRVRARKDATRSLPAVFAA